MLWVAPSEKDTATATLEKRLWDTADQFRANSGLKAQEQLETLNVQGRELEQTIAGNVADILEA
jgi:hypothetical protein